MEPVFVVIVSHPVWLPEGEQTEFFCPIKAAKLEESALEAGFNVTTEVTVE